MHLVKGKIYLPFIYVDMKLENLLSEKNYRLLYNLKVCKSPFKTVIFTDRIYDPESAFTEAYEYPFDLSFSNRGG